MSWPGELHDGSECCLQRDKFDANLEEEMQLHVELRRQQQIEAGLRRRRAVRRSPEVRQRGRDQGEEPYDVGLELAGDSPAGCRLRRSVDAAQSCAGCGRAAVACSWDRCEYCDLQLSRCGDAAFAAGEAAAAACTAGYGDWDGISDGFAITELYSYPFYRQMQKKNAVFSVERRSSAWRIMSTVSLKGATQSEPMNVQLVSGTYFPTLGVNAVMGRMLTDDDDNSRGRPSGCRGQLCVVEARSGAGSRGVEQEAEDRRDDFRHRWSRSAGVFGTKVGDAPDIWVPLSMMEQVPPNWKGYTDDFAEANLHHRTVETRCHAGSGHCECKPDLISRFCAAFPIPS